LRVSSGEDSSIIGFIASYTLKVSNTLKPSISSTYNVNVTEFVQPEIIRCSSRQHEVALGELGVNFGSTNIEFMKNPLLHETLFSSGLKHRVSKTYLGSTGTLTLAELSGTNVSSSFNMANFVALKILLQNFRYPSTRKISRLMSRPF